MSEEPEVRSAPSLLYEVKRLELAIRARLDEVLGESGVTTLQYTALTVLVTHGGASTAQLARLSFVTAQSMSDMVRQLESRGLVGREPNPRSKRELLVHITEDGRALLEANAVSVAELEARMTGLLNPQEVDGFRHALRKGWESLR